MKIILFLVVITSIPFGVCGQENQIAGEYGKSSDPIHKHVVEWTVQLKDDGTFSYNFYRHLSCDSCEEENFSGKGTWTAEEKLITFETDVAKDLDSTYTMNFTNTKARFQSKSARNTSNKVIPDVLIFYESPLPEIQGLKLQKKKT
ncbi:MAG: hypothetical protein WBM77_07470 [Maribacter sp.]